MEAEMDAIIESLCGPSGPGLSGNLVDSEVTNPIQSNPNEHNACRHLLRFQIVISFLCLKNLFNLLNLIWSSLSLSLWCCRDFRGQTSTFLPYDRNVAGWLVCWKWKICKSIINKWFTRELVVEMFVFWFMLLRSLTRSVAFVFFSKMWGLFIYLLLSLMGRLTDVLSLCGTFTS